MPRSRSRRKRQAPRARRGRFQDSMVLVELLDEIDASDGDDFDEDDPLEDDFNRAAWSFYAGPGPDYASGSEIDRSLAHLRAREWFLLEFEGPSGLTAAEEWVLWREGEPRSGAVRRAVRRFVNGECGVFDIREVRPDGSMLLGPLPGGAPLRARRIEQAYEMLSGPNPLLPEFRAGDAIAGRLYWRDDGWADLSAGACLVAPDVRARLLADPPETEELASGLGLEAALGADPSKFFDYAADPCFPDLADDLLSSLSDGAFSYRRLWRELEGASSPVAVARQLLRELEEWTDTEPVLLAWTVAGTWLRRREADAARRLSAATVEGARAELEREVQAALDSTDEPEWPPADARGAVEIPESEAPSDIAALEVDEVEWLVDHRPGAPLSSAEEGTARPAEPVATIALAEGDVVDIGPLDEIDAEDEEHLDEGGEEDIIGYDDDEEDADEEEDDEEEEDEEDEEDEDGTDDLGVEEDDEVRWLAEAPVQAGEDEARVALGLLLDTLRAGDRATRPRRIVFRQRALAARLGGALRDAGFEVELRYFDDAVDAAILNTAFATSDAPGEDEAGAEELEAAPGSPASPAATEAASEAERASYARLVDACVRAQEGLESLAINGESGEAVLIVKLARPLALPFATYERIEPEVGSVGVFASGGTRDVRLYFRFAPPGIDTAFDCRGPGGRLVPQSGDWIQIEIGESAEEDTYSLADLRAAGFLPALESETSPPPLVARRFEYATVPFVLRGRQLDFAAGLLEAVAAAATLTLTQGDEDGRLEARVDPLGDLTVEWQGWL